jgi:hypothetical protein
MLPSGWTVDGVAPLNHNFAGVHPSWSALSVLPQRRKSYMNSGTVDERTQLLQFLIGWCCCLHCMQLDALLVAPRQQPLSLQEALVHPLCSPGAAQHANLWLKVFAGLCMDMRFAFVLYAIEGVHTAE